MDVAQPNTLNNFVEIESIDLSLSANTALACQGDQFSLLLHLTYLVLILFGILETVIPLKLMATQAIFTEALAPTTLRFKQALLMDYVLNQSASTIIDILGLNPSFASDVQTSCSTRLLRFSLLPSEALLAMFGVLEKEGSTRAPIPHIFTMTLEIMM